MFGGRRRRPILGTALVIGASRASARHEVERQMSAQAQREWDIERAAEAKNREKREQDARVQRSVEEALKKSNVTGNTCDPTGNTCNPSVSQAAPPIVSQGAPQLNALNTGIPNTGIPLVPPPSYTAAQNTGPGMQPATLLVSDMQKIQYCPACGNGCDIMDRFCRKCGARQQA